MPAVSLLNGQIFFSIEASIVILLTLFYSNNSCLVPCLDPYLEAINYINLNLQHSLTPTPPHCLEFS